CARTDYYGSSYGDYW
nr:immunoglobulin heavy chain junction region [Mus musculus]